MKKKDQIDVRLEAFKAGYTQAIGEAVIIVRKHFENDWNGGLAIADLKKLLEGK
jgi:hypothetical protein